MKFEFGDVILVSFPFSSGTLVKKRPALILLDTGDLDVVVARITTQLPNSEYDISVQDWSVANLLAQSVVRLHKLATIEKSLVQRKLGHITNQDRDAVQRVLRNMPWGDA